MATITKRTNPSGAVVYRAQVRVKKAGYPDFSESRTFSKKSLATEWAKRREAELEAHPELLFGETEKVLCPTLREAAKRYKDETQTSYAQSKYNTIDFVMNFEIADKRIDRLTRSDFTSYAFDRQRGRDDLGARPVSPATINGDLQYVRSILKHAHFVWGFKNVLWTEIDIAMEGLRRARVIAKAKRRDRLPTNDELQRLTTYFLRVWRRVVVNPKRVPMHLLMWFAIYSCRRQDEIARIEWADYDEQHAQWLVRDLKHPRGSKGNHKTFTVTDDIKNMIEKIRSPAIQKQMNMPHSEYLLGGYKGKTISALWQRACADLGIKDLRFHDLRHEGATRLAEQGLTIPQMQQITLHGDWESMRRYTNLRKRPPVLNFEEAIKIADDELKKETTPERDIFA